MLCVVCVERVRVCVLSECAAGCLSLVGVCFALYVCALLHVYVCSLALSECVFGPWAQTQKITHT